MKAECPTCDGTGIHRGHCEPPGLAVICLKCHGKGYEEVRKFTHLKRVHGVQEITRSTLDGPIPGAERIPYAEFLKGTLPTPPPR